MNKINARSPANRPTEFPKTITAVRTFEDAKKAADAASKEADVLQWAIGDALIEECGPPGPDGVNTGSSHLLKKAAAKLNELGFRHYSYDHLRKLRSIADHFPAGVRTPASWSVYAVAGDPKTFRMIKEQADRDDVPLTVKFAKACLKHQNEQRDKDERQGRDKPNGRNPKRAMALEAFRKAKAEVERIEERTKVHISLVRKEDPEAVELIEAVDSFRALLETLVETRQAAE